MADDTDLPPSGLAAPPGQQFTITRQSLLDGSLLARARANAPPDSRYLNDAEIEASLDATLAALPPGEDAWLFGYGSLMWNPAIEYAEQRVATIHGFHRSYCLWLVTGRGSPEHPGLMLALDRGGSCRGLAFRIPASSARSELLLAWRREMFGGSYKARWVTARTAAGPVRAIAYVVNHAHPRYAGKLPEDEIARRIATAAGALGTCEAYLSETLGALNALGVRDPGLERIQRRVAGLTGSASPSGG
jgi:glutathione-specific gamma-glutamylcyclotransferase